MENLDFLKFVADMEKEGVEVFDAELSIKRKSGKQETFINGNALSVLVAAEELAARAINSVRNRAPLTQKDAYIVFCENLKYLLEQKEVGKE